MSPVLLCGFRIQNSHFWIRITSLYGSQTSPVILCMQYSVISIRITSLYRSHLRFLHVKQRLLYRISNLCGSQSSPVVLCMKNGVISTRITSLYGSQHTSEVFASKTATFGPGLLVSMGRRHHLSFCACNTV